MGWPLRRIQHETGIRRNGGSLPQSSRNDGGGVGEVAHDTHVLAVEFAVFVMRDDPESCSGGALAAVKREAHGEAEVSNHRPFATAARVDQDDVVRLQVAVHDAERVHSSEGGNDVPDERKSFYAISRKRQRWNATARFRRTSFLVLRAGI
jgi:hypothetical protein